MVPEATVADHSFKAAAIFAVHRYSFGQTVLDNDIHRAAHKLKGDQDPRDVQLPQVDRDIRHLLGECPAQVITVKLAATFASRSFEHLTSKNKHLRGAALSHLKDLFDRMADYHLGRVRGTGQEMRFEKRHAAGLGEFGADYVRNKLRLPLWLFGVDMDYEAPAPVQAKIPQTASPKLAPVSGAPIPRPARTADEKKEVLVMASGVDLKPPTSSFNHHPPNHQTTPLIPEHTTQRYQH